ncbi:MAG TPA: hypothetical protein VD971_13400 [Phycisphaerales bacterium]|nr:hypothetical protein [Phycisphaerales bacterium]
MSRWACPLFCVMSAAACAQDVAPVEIVTGDAPARPFPWLAASLGAGACIAGAVILWLAIADHRRRRLRPRNVAGLVGAVRLDPADAEFFAVAKALGVPTGDRQRVLRVARARGLSCAVGLILSPTALERALAEDAASARTLRRA